MISGPCGYPQGFPFAFVYRIFIAVLPVREYTGKRKIL